MMIYFWGLVSSVVESVSYGPRVLRFDSRPDSEKNYLMKILGVDF